MTDTINIFEQASRQKLRFDTFVGKVAVEDLWALPLTATNPDKVTLDSIGVALKKQLEGTSESLVNNPKKDAVVQLKFDIVKHIIDTRVAENAAKLEAEQKAEQRGKLDRLIAAKEEDKLASMPLEDLQKMRDAL